MSTAEDSYAEVKTLPEAEARAVLDFVVRLKGRRELSNEARRDAALSTLKRYRGRFNAVKTQRDDLHEHKNVR